MSQSKEAIPEFWLDLLTDTLKQLDVGIQAAFLQKFLHSILGREVSENESITHWEGILARQNQLIEKLGRPVTHRTAAVDYFEGISLMWKPVLLEYEELKKLRYNAATDPLTGLNNRRMFEEYLDQEIDRSTRYGASFALLLFDLRKFKSVNDTFGHAVGDEILKSVARASLEAIRGSDIPCRTGGDEFAILLPQAERSGSEVLADRIARKFEEYAGSLAPGAPVGIDYGIAIFPEDGHDANSLFAAADRTLYASKQKAHIQSAATANQPPDFAQPVEKPTGQVKMEAPFPSGDRPARLYPPDALPGTGLASQVSEDGPNGRRFQRVPMEGSPTLGIVRVAGKTRTIKVLDASRGGVCILDDQIDLPETFQALLQVPMLPRGELTLQRIYTLVLPDGKRRVGCALTSTSDLGSA